MVAYGMIAEHFKVVITYDRLMELGSNAEKHFDQFITFQILTYLIKANMERNNHILTIKFLEW